MNDKPCPICGAAKFHREPGEAPFVDRWRCGRAVVVGEHEHLHDLERPCGKAEDEVKRLTADRDEARRVRDVKWDQAKDAGKRLYATQALLAESAKLLKDAHDLAISFVKDESIDAGMEQEVVDSWWADTEASARKLIGGYWELLKKIGEVAK